MSDNTTGAPPPADDAGVKDKFKSWVHEVLDERDKAAKEAEEKATTEEKKRTADRPNWVEAFFGR